MSALPCWRRSSILRMSRHVTSCRMHPLYAELLHFCKGPISYGETAAPSPYLLLRSVLPNIREHTHLNPCCCHIVTDEMTKVERSSSLAMSYPCAAVPKGVCAMQDLAKEEGRRLQALRERVASASREASSLYARGAHAHRQFAILQHAPQAEQHSRHITHPRACTSNAQPDQGCIQPPIEDASEQMTPTRQHFSLWQEDPQSPEGKASGSLQNQTYQTRCARSPECTTSHGGSPIRLTAGHWQYVPSSGSADVLSPEHAQRAGRLLHSQELAQSTLHGKLHSAEAEVARLRAQLQAQHVGRDVSQSCQPSHGELLIPASMRKQSREDNFSATWAQERENNPFAKKASHKGAAGVAAPSGPHAELVSVSAQVAQQRGLLQQLTSQVLQVRVDAGY